jgi:hypothetical protein
LWLGLFKREEEEKVIEVMKKGRMEGGGVWRLLHCKKRLQIFRPPAVSRRGIIKLDGSGEENR